MYLHMSNFNQHAAIGFLFQSLIIWASKYRCIRGRRENGPRHFRLGCVGGRTVIGKYQKISLPHTEHTKENEERSWGKLEKHSTC